MGEHERTMIVYKCIVSGNEILTDSTDAEELFGGTILRCVAKYIEVGGEEEFDIGANASAEGGDDEGVDESAKEKVLDLVYNFKLNQMEYSKKEFMTWAKGFLKKCVMYMKENDRADEVPAFKTNIQEALKDFTSSWDDFCVYVDEDFNTDGITILCRYEGDDGATPHFYYIAWAECREVLGCFITAQLATF